MKPHLLSLSTAVPAHVLELENVISEARRIFAGYGAEFQRLLPVYANAGIRTRYAICPPEWFRDPHDWGEKSALYLTESKALFRKVAAEALERAGLAAREVGTIVTVSSTGIATPTIEAHVMHDMGFRDDVRRVPVFGLGCAGGLSGLSLAARLATADPGRPVLLVVIELCSLAFRPDEMTKSNVVASALFADGAAAAVVTARAGGDGPAIEFAGEHTWADTTDIMGWKVEQQGLSAIFSRSIPDFALRYLRPAAESFLARNGLSLESVDHQTFHPGGAKVIEALETAFGLEAGVLQDERDVLSRFGNMSAPTVLFVLAQALTRKQKGRRMLGALGPGFTMSFMTMVQA